MSWKKAIETALSEKFKTHIKIISSHYVGGGSINDTRMIKTNKGDFFVKMNSAGKFPGMFEKEAKGLKILDSANVIDVPEPLLWGETGDTAFLVLNYINSSHKKNGFWEDFGTKLALLHKNSSDMFGLDHDNYIGSLPQSNKQHRRWEDFFVLERLEPQIKLALNSGEIDKSFVKLFDNLFSKIDRIFPDEPPALLHGDLWGGNYMTNEKGNPVLIDPAVYYGHREMDLGMTRLFGGFDNEFYYHYNKKYPLEKGWEERLEICNLYPLMVHVNLFGGGYSGSVKAILKRFV